MLGFILIGFSLLSGDTLPWSIRLLMFVGGAASLASPFVSHSPVRDDSGSGYPTQADVLDHDDD